MIRIGILIVFFTLFDCVIILSPILIKEHKIQFLVEVILRVNYLDRL
jgi:hypothetical protein